MHVTIITDCADENAISRLSARSASLFDSSVHVLPLHADLAGSSADISAAGHLIDTLDAYEDREWVILVNVAPRGWAASRHANGTPFGYFRHRRTLVVATLDGYCLSLAKSFGLLEDLRVFDIPTALASLPESVRPDMAERERIAATQFRSYEFQPRVACWLAQGIDVASEPYDLSLIPDLAPCVWHADNFGNLKTSIEATDIPLDTKFLHTVHGVFPVVPRLRDVPDGEAAFTVGSSGLGGCRFLELAVSRGSAGARYGLRAGDPLAAHGTSPL